MRSYIGCQCQGFYFSYHKMLYSYQKYAWEYLQYNYSNKNSIEQATYLQINQINTFYFGDTVAHRPLAVSV